MVSDADAPRRWSIKAGLIYFVDTFTWIINSEELVDFHLFAQFQRTNFWPQNDPFLFTVPTRRAKSTPVFFSLATKPLPLDSFNKLRIFYVLYTGNLLSQQQDRETRFNRFSWISTQIRLQELKVEIIESTTGFHLSPPRNADSSVFFRSFNKIFLFNR